MTGEQLLIKTIKQCNAFEARVIELESDEYVNNLKADAIQFAAGQINGQCDGELCYDILISNVEELRGNN